MNNIFFDVKQPLSRSNLESLTEQNYSNVNGGLTYIELQKSLEEKGLTIDKFFMSKKGLYPFWYVDEYLFIPVPSLDVTMINDYLNSRSVGAQKEKLKKYLEKMDYEAFFSLLESQFGFAIFFEILETIPSSKRYPVFRKLYTLNEYGFQDIDKDVIRTIFSLNKGRVKTNGLKVDNSGYVTIYRGAQDKSANVEESYSWTTDFNIAKMFATRVNSVNSAMYKAKVHKDAIVDFITTRGESEVIVLYKDLVDVENLDYLNLNQKTFDDLRESGLIAEFQKHALINLNPKWFKNPDGIHGIRHIKRVLFLSLIMSHIDSLSNTDKQILIYASLYHDIGRTNDFKDDSHGKKSVFKRRKLELDVNGLNKEELRILEFIMQYHCIDDKEGIAKIETLSDITAKERAVELLKRFKDCDNLDRVRLGDLNTRYLRTETGKRLMFVAYQLLRNIE